MASAAGKPACKIQCPPCGGGGLGPRARLRPPLDPRSLEGSDLRGAAPGGRDLWVARPRDRAVARALDLTFASVGVRFGSENECGLVLINAE